MSVERNTHRAFALLVSLFALLFVTTLSVVHKSITNLSSVITWDVAFE